MVSLCNLPSFGWPHYGSEAVDETEGNPWFPSLREEAVDEQSGTHGSPP